MKPTRIETRTRRVLENPLTYVSVLFLTLVANLVHTTSEYNAITGTTGVLPYAMLIIVDLAVVLFAYNGNKAATIAFTVFLFLINLSHFWRSIDLNFQDIGMAVIFSSVFSVSIYIFSEEFVKRVQR